MELFSESPISETDSSLERETLPIWATSVDWLKSHYPLMKCPNTLISWVGLPNRSLLDNSPTETNWVSGASVIRVNDHTRVTDKTQSPTKASVIQPTATGAKAKNLQYIPPLLVVQFLAIQTKQTRTKTAHHTSHLSGSFAPRESTHYSTVHRSSVEMLSFRLSVKTLYIQIPEMQPTQISIW